MPNSCGRCVNAILASFLRGVLSFVGRMNDLVKRLAVNWPSGHSSRCRQVYRFASLHRKLLRLDTSTELLSKLSGLVNAAVRQHDKEMSEHCRVVKIRIGSPFAPRPSLSAIA